MRLGYARPVTDGVTPDARERRAAARATAASREPRRIGRYELLFELARGGMGSVWVGRLHGAHGFGRFVAIKALPCAPDFAELIPHFLDEAKVAARVHHPNVVQTLDLFEHDGEPFMVMELVRGVSLARLDAALSAAGEVLPPEVAAWIVMQAAAGLHAAHELKDPKGASLELVHRDVSPQNLLLSFEGRVYVADFGIAKFHRDYTTTASGVIKGKFAYMSPEQACARALDRRSDVFALGVVLYEALTGTRLYSAEHPGEALLKIVNDAVPDPREARREVPAELATITARCLAKKPEDRWPTMADLADAIRAAIAGSGADEHRASAIVRRLFPDEDRALRGQLENAEAPTEIDAGDAAATLEAQMRPVTDVTAAPALPLRRWPAVATALGIVALTAVAFAVVRATGAFKTGARAATSSVASVAGSSPPTPPAFEPPAAGSLAPATAHEASTSPAPEVASQRRPGTKPRPAAHPSASAAAPAPTPVATPSATAKKIGPFQDL
jgi:eukaryotic-like serine/threonine-protein kinase